MPRHITMVYYCKNCGIELPPKGKHGMPRTVWCSRKCRDKWRYWNVNKAKRKPNGKGPKHRISAEKIAEVKARYPSTAKDWDIAMVERAWPRLTSILPRSLNTHDKHN